MADENDGTDDDRVSQNMLGATWHPAKGSALNSLSKCNVIDIYRIEGGDDDGMIRIEEGCDNYYSITAPPEFLRDLAHELLKVADQCRKTN